MAQKDDREWAFPPTDSMSRCDFVSRAMLAGVASVALGGIGAAQSRAKKNIHAKMRSR